MNRIFQFFERGLFAPFLFAVLPILQLYLLNLDELAFADTVRALLVSLAFASLVFGGLFVFLRDALKSALIAALLVFLFFLFGDLTDWVSKTFGLGPARSGFAVFLVAVAILSVWVWLLLRRVKNPVAFNLYFNLLGVLLLANTGVQVAKHLQENELSFNPSDRVMTVTEVASTAPRPDIYYIILDGYGRQDVLEQFYNFDNSSFIDGLRERGFYVADQASSNYIQTMLSLTSSFNMDYLQDLTINGKTPDNRAELIELLNFSELRAVLTKNGYRTVSFENEYKATLPTADVYYSNDASRLTQSVSAFESIVIDHSFARVLNYIPFFHRALTEMPYETHRQYILSAFSELKETPALDGDYFVYAHIIAPHPPFVFDKDGAVIAHDEPFTLFDANYYISEHSRGGYIAGYRKQIQYINALTLETIDTILAESETPPIIILQGDHGPGAYLHWGSLEATVPSERFGILNAYYFPDQNYEALYPSISPVNSFRVTLNQYFQTDYAALPDLHYYSRWNVPFDFIEVTDLSLPK
ncbi:MAG: hypothetical protein DCC56_14085 [Anaerolineae bacterium]|nr:MAG: hypothetical protein DCC56_14085 [Anaerolineae bacterium]WKZ44294.1 MAG: hypothetical protein QY302_00720 [Anaerolineales bacterium]